MLGTLVSVAQGKTAVIRTAEAIKNGVPLIVDSGAWSVFNDKAKIDVIKHIKYLEANWVDNVRHIGLDVIGDYQQSLANWLIEQEAGWNVEPTIHYPESPDKVDAYLNSGYSFDWINLGGMAHLQRQTTLLPRLASWCAAIMKRLPPEVKVHGLGATTPAFIDIIPFDGVDSSYWMAIETYGRIALYEEGRNAWVTLNRGKKSKAWQDNGPQSLGKNGDWLMREYGISGTELMDADFPTMIDLIVRGHKRFANHYSARHNKQIYVYMAGFKEPYYPVIRSYNDA